MTDTEILEKYGTIKLEFDSLYKHSVTYISANKKYKVYGLAEYRGDLKKEMTVGELWQELSIFDFELLS